MVTGTRNRTMGSGNPENPVDHTVEQPGNVAGPSHKVGSKNPKYVEVLNRRLDDQAVENNEFRNEVRQQLQEMRNLLLEGVHPFVAPNVQSEEHLNQSQHHQGQNIRGDVNPVQSMQSTH